MDVKIVFLNDDLQEEVYSHQPIGFMDDKNMNGVLRLSKVLYRLRHASRAWNAKLDAFSPRWGLSATHKSMRYIGETPVPRISLLACTWTTW
jgi:hypothetical protein